MKAILHSALSSVLPRHYSMSKRVSAPPVTQPAPVTEQPPLVPVAPAATEATVVSTPRPSSPTNHRVHFRLVFQSFTPALQDSVKLRHEDSITAFLALLAQCRSLYDSPTLPSELEVPVSDLYNRMLAFHSVIHNSHQRLTTTTEIEEKRKSAEMKIRLERAIEEKQLMMEKEKIKARLRALREAKKQSAKYKKRKHTRASTKRKLDHDDAESDADEADVDEIVEEEEKHVVKPLPKPTAPAYSKSSVKARSTAPVKKAQSLSLLGKAAAAAALKIATNPKAKTQSATFESPEPTVRVTRSSSKKQKVGDSHIDTVDNSAVKPAGTTTLSATGSRVRKRLNLANEQPEQMNVEATRQSLAKLRNRTYISETSAQKFRAEEARLLASKMRSAKRVVVGAKPIVEDVHTKYQRDPFEF